MDVEGRPRLKIGELVVGAWAEDARGPGWTNSLVWFVVREPDGHLRVEALQDCQFNAELRQLWAARVALSQDLIRQVADLVRA